YDTWWHGGFRSAPYFHSSIGILSEAASANLMTPVTVKREDLARNRTTRGLPDLLSISTNYPDTWDGGLWRPVDINNIEMTSSRALLQMAAKFRPRYRRNFYELGKANLQADPTVPQESVVFAGQPSADTVSRYLARLTYMIIELQAVATMQW